MGRRTKQAELEEFVQAAGVDPQLLADFLGGEIEPEAVPTSEELRDELMRLLWQRRVELKGIALVQGLKALADLARSQKPAEEDDRGAVDVLAALDSLPPERALPLVEAEMTRLEALYRQYEGAYARLTEGAPE